jgi:hypothetical protein
MERKKFFGWQDSEDGYVADYLETKSSFYVRMTSDDAAAALVEVNKAFGDVTMLAGVDAPDGEFAFTTAIISEKELAEIETFANKTKIHQKYKEGDFFRYRINRSLYGYGRILMNFDKMRKDGIDFWNLFMGKPLCVAVCHIATNDAHMSPEQLVDQKMLPAQMIMDNIFFYGECEIIGNLPLKGNEAAYPIHYGKSISMQHPHCLHYQCGKTFVTLENKKALYGDFVNGSIGWTLDVKLPILNACIRYGANDPYWMMIHPYQANKDLRNPKFKKELAEIQKQMGII